MSELLLPYEGRVRLESPFGWRTLNGKEEFHNGVDLIGIDSKVILSPCSGLVGISTIINSPSNKTWEWGNYVRINYKNMKIYMCHMDKRFVNSGTDVKAREPIGIEGNTGYSFGSHCHFEIRINDEPVDPTPYLGIENKKGEYINPPAYGHDWSESSVKWAIENNILKGYNPEKEDFKLEQPITREEVIVFLHRLYGII